MATFSKNQLISASPSLIPEMAQAIRRDFQQDGFEVNIENLYSGGADISITKGGFFKAVLGLKSALKISLQPRGNAVLFDANVGIFGQQVIPAIIAYFWCWPVMLTQIWGLIQQSQLDERALADAMSVCGKATPMAAAGGSFCPNCGTQVPQGARFCPSCGNQM